MSISIADILFVIVIFQLFFISIFLYTHNKGRLLSNRLLATFFLCVSLNLVDSFFALQKVYLLNPSFAGWGSCLPLLFGPLLYLYARSVLYKEFWLAGKQWIHFLPFLMCFLVTEAGFLLQPREMKLTILNAVIERKLPMYVYWVSVFIFLQFFAYIFVSFVLIRQYKRIAENNFSDRQRTNVSWLFSTIAFFTVCMLMAALNGFIGLTPLASYYYLFLFLIVVFVFIFINRVLLKALRSPEIFLLTEDVGNISENKPVSNTALYSGSSLTTETKNELLKSLQQCMEIKKPYLEPELNLRQLADLLSVKPKALSQVINEVLHQNFFEFVNSYRIEEAKRLLKNPADKKITVLEVLYESGFNSKSSFNTLFKKQTGLTPGEFKRKNQH